MSKYLGLEEIEYLYNGACSEPQIKYKGFIFNYYDLEELLSNVYRELLEEGDTNQTFEQYFKENPEIVYSKLEEMITDFFETNLQESPFKEINSLRENLDKELFNQSLLYQIKAIESTYDIEILDYFKVPELESTSNEDFYQYLIKTCIELKENNQFLDELKEFPKKMEEELNEYIDSLEKLEKEPVITEEDLEETINVKLDDGNFLSFWNSMSEDGIYYEINDKDLEEIDGGLQLYGLINTRDKILQNPLIKSLLEMSDYKCESFERLPNGDLEEVLIEIREKETRYKISIYETKEDWEQGEPFVLDTAYSLEEADKILNKAMKENNYYSGLVFDTKTGIEERAYYSDEQQEDIDEEEDSL